MTLEDQVAPLAESRRMAELGFPQETLFVWMGSGGPDRCELVPNPALRNQWAWNDVRTKDPAMRRVAAPTVAELGEALPNWTGLPEQGDLQGRDGWSIPEPFGMADPPKLPDFPLCATEAEARARLWIALAEAGELA